MKNLSKQARLGLLALAVIIALGVWLVTKGEDNDKTSKPVAVNSEVQNKCKTQVDDELFCKFAGAFAGVGDYRMTMTNTAANGSSVIEMANSANGNSSLVSTVDGKENANLVVFNGTTYAKDPSDGKWLKFSSTNTNKPETVDLKKEFVKADFKNGSGKKETYINKGTEACGSLTCYKYQSIDPDKPGTETFIWFDNQDYLLRRLSGKEGSTTTEITVKYETVTINEPSPTKDAPASSQ